MLLVSHTLAAVVKNCNRCLWLDDGRVRADGEAREVVSLYMREHGTEPVEHEGGRLKAQA